LLAGAPGSNPVVSMYFSFLWLLFVIG